MLQLRINNYTMNMLISNEYRRYDYNLVGRNGVPGVGYVRTNILESAMAPIALNAIGILQKTYCVNDNTDVEAIINNLNETFEQLSDTRLAILRCYTSDVAGFTAQLSNDLFINPPTAVQELYNKCIDQSRLRENYTGEAHIAVKLMRAKHAILIITDYLDPNQGSDMFLTIGLTPVLFPDWKEKFNEEELEYFKTLVNRSQVKRISNVKANEAFNIMMSNTKYEEQLREIQLKNAVESIVANRIREARNTLDNAERNANDILRRYEEEQKRYYTSLKVLNDLEHSRESAIDEIQTAVKLDGIVDVQTRSNEALTIAMKVPVSFFNTDEAECVVDRMDDCWIKDFFTDVFIEQKYKLMLYSHFYFDFNPEHSFRAPGQIEVELLNCHDALFNPHFYFYQCLGDYKAQLIDAQAKGDLLMFNSIALASLKSINFRDGAVINRFKDFLRGLESGGYTNRMFANINCLVDNEGHKHSIYELYLSEETNEPIELEVRDA